MHLYRDMGGSSAVGDDLNKFDWPGCSATANRRRTALISARTLPHAHICTCKERSFRSQLSTLTVVMERDLLLGEEVRRSKVKVSSYTAGKFRPRASTSLLSNSSSVFAAWSPTLPFPIEIMSLNSECAVELWDLMS